MACDAEGAIDSLLHRAVQGCPGQAQFKLKLNGCGWLASEPSLLLHVRRIRTPNEPAKGMQNVGLISVDSVTTQ